MFRRPGPLANRLPIQRFLQHRLWQRLCELRPEDQVPPIVVCTLKLMTGKSKKLIKANHKKADDLKEGQAFDSAGTGLFQTPLIQMIANVMWFANKFYEGIDVSWFNFGHIECCIGEWMTGVRVNIDFTEAEYKSVFDGHLRDLIPFDKHTQSLLDKKCVKIHNRGRFHACVQPLSELANRGAAQFDAAIKEYEIRDHTESDGENGCLTEEGKMMAAAA
ncbi:hypothetical protein B0H11DRAFT_1908639 [Mycena galericulata]|nr:hypothetical protein B0H11DRAFT_1908639 [Mycena galericulata]